MRRVIVKLFWLLRNDIVENTSWENQISKFRAAAAANAKLFLEKR